MLEFRFGNIYLRRCLQETIGNMSRNLRALVTKSSLKERYKTAQNYLEKIKFLVEDVSDENECYAQRRLTTDPICSHSTRYRMSSFG